MKRVVVVGCVLLVGALNWAALHDILKGETDLRGEWAVVVGTLVVAGATIGWRALKRRA
jgi:hypothetical protein